MATRLKYQTGVVTLIQFLVGTALGFLNDLYSSISGCTGSSNDCVSNAITSLSLIILTAIWFAFVAALGYAAQDRRSHRLARLLILAELAIVAVALFDILHYPNIFGLITSLIDLFLACWALLLAYRLNKAKGGRIVAKTPARARQRRHTL